MSAPAQKLAPAPVTTTTRTRASVASATSAACSSCTVVPSRALCLSGRFSVSVATPRASTLVVTRGMAEHLHAEDAVAFRSRLRSAHRGADRLAEHAARVDRIDDAIVPEPRSSVVRIALRFVLLANLAHERLTFAVRPRLVARLQTVAAHCRKHLRRLFAAHHGDARVRPGPDHARRIRPAAHRIIA